MKKIVFILISFLIGLFVLLSALTPENNFVAEKQLWKINKKFYAMTKKSDLPSENFDQIIPLYENFIHKFPKSSLLPQAYIFLADVYLFKKDYATARQKYEETIQKFSDQPTVVVKTMNRIILSYGKEETVASVFDRQNKINQTVENLYDPTDMSGSTMKKMFIASYKEEKFYGILKVYQRAMKEFPTSSLGLQAPLLIAKLYYNQKKPKKTTEALDKAIKYYQNIAQQHKNSLIDLQAQELLATCYSHQKNLRAAINVLAEVLIRFAESPYLTPKKALSIVKVINTFAMFQLKDVDIPIEIYQKFITTYPNHPFNQFLKKVIQRLHDSTENLSPQP